MDEPRLPSWRKRDNYTDIGAQQLERNPVRLWSAPDGPFKVASPMAKDLEDITRQTLVVRDRKPSPHPESQTSAPERDPSDASVEPTASQQVPKVGDQLGSYRLLKILGDGAGGRVFLAQHTLLEKRVALKMSHPRLKNDPKLIRRFFSEAKAVSQLEHENIVAIKDFVVSAEHPSFYVMELLEGETLAARLTEGRTLPTSQAIDFGIQLASALDAAHHESIVHRDLKPSNVFLTKKKNGQIQVKLLDFGVAKVPRATSSQERLTKIGTLIGSPMYMAPEATYGLDVDERADLYSFGVVLYEMLTGRPPFQGGSIEVLLQGHREEQPPPPRSVAPQPENIPEALEQLILRCLEKRPTNRPNSARLIKDILQELAPAPPVETPAPMVEPMAASYSDIVVPTTAEEPMVASYSDIVAPTTTEGWVDDEPSSKQRQVKAPRLLRAIVIGGLLGAIVAFVIYKTSDRPSKDTARLENFKSPDQGVPPQKKAASPPVELEAVRVETDDPPPPATKPSIPKAPKKRSKPRTAEPDWKFPNEAPTTDDDADEPL